ncbi:ZIP-like iron-zinc transporter [Desarmillaria tabescens]|uniref:ZIP-like iron-zinc transporter n=1 Tax=Armillaria tabescens TaxID=1929756 RepID=A0AA39NQA8_ARMTA|nr:ZIP-like iron-zinc transporter [Desarmillaria tabescens]KAK0469583.1 ZIP-like iron-zinc transporter [Desarmillaria tabescens]
MIVNSHNDHRSRRTRFSISTMAQRSLLFAVVLLVVASLYALEIKDNAAAIANDTIITVDSIHHCASVQQLSAIKIAAEAQESPIMRKIFAWLFPFGPAWNSVLGTFYISSVPNFILAFIPARINGNTLNTMTAFATGGLLSDVFLHLVPHSFMGEHQDPGVHFVMVEEKRNILIGLGIFSGFAAFFFMEKTLRVLGGEDDSGHSHSHSHVQPSDDSSARASAVSMSSGSNNLKSRAPTSASAEAKESSPGPSHAATGPSKLSAYLNLFGDFVHNITDGLAMAASFYASPLIGATTTLACFAHEIPHEIADYSILIRSGFTKKQAMQSQFLTAVGAFVGTFIGIAVHNATSSTDSASFKLDLGAGARQNATGLLGTTLMIADLVIPFVAGGFLYIGAVAVLPTLLAESKSGAQAVREFAAMFVGVVCMLLVAWNE